MNSVNVIGRLTTEAELRYTANNIPCVSVFIAINNGKDKDGNDRPADFPKVYVYEKQAENMAKYCKKGSKVGVSGRIKTRSWDKEDGTKGYETYILASRIEFLDAKQSEGVPLPEPEYTTEKEENDPFSDFGESIEVSEDELPF